MKPLCYLVLGIALIQIAAVNSFSKILVDAYSNGELYNNPGNFGGRIESSVSKEAHDVLWGYGRGEIKNILSTSVENNVKPTMVGAAYSCNRVQSDDEILKSFKFFNKIIVNIAVWQDK